MNRIYTGGTFDLFHAGHVRFLEQCASFGPVYVSVNSDEFVAQYKGRPPVIPFMDRIRVVGACRYVERVLGNLGGMDSREAILQVRPTVIAIGSDWARRDYYTQMGFTQDWLDEQGISLLYIPYTHGISSEQIREQIGGR